MVYVEKEKKPREAFSGELRSLKVREDALTTAQRDGRAVTAYKYLDISVLDREQPDPKTGQPGLWHNIRISAPKEAPIVLEEHAVLKQCDEFITAKRYPNVRGKFYISESEKRDPATKKIVIENGQAVVYRNKKMSIPDIKSLEIVSVPDAPQAAEAAAPAA